MKSWLLVFALSISTTLSELTIRDGYTSKVVRVPFKKEKSAVTNANVKRRDGKTVYQKVDNKDFLFYANVSLGSPPQPVRLHIDTGSSDIWVETSRSPICIGSSNSCKVGGTYDNLTSSSYEYVPGDFAITYVDGQYAKGEYARDTLEIGGVGVKNVQFGIGYEGTSDEGVLGLGFESRQSGVLRGQPQYPGLVTQMAEQGLINSRCFSVWLNDLNAESGEILFGGIDTAKFEPPLMTIPLSTRQGMDHATDYVIMLKGLTVTNERGEDKSYLTEGVSTPALLDTGASFTYLPNDVMQELVTLVGAQIIPEYRGPAINCTKRSMEGTVNFAFAGVTIRVKLADFIIDATDEPNDDNSVLCYFGILGMKDGAVLTLGDTFLRSAYVVYDIDNEEISLAPTIFNTTKSSVVEIGNGAEAIPSLTAIASSVTDIPSEIHETGSPNTTTTTTGSPDSKLPSAASAPVASHSLNIPSALLVLIISFAIFL